MRIIKHKWIFLSFSGLLVAASIYGLVAFGLQKGIDFTGGTLWQVQLMPDESGVVPTRAELLDFVHDDLGATEATITEQETAGVFLIKTKEMSELLHQDYARRLRQEFGEVQELSFASIGAVIGSELASKAIWALIITLLTISLYIAYAFRKVSYPISSWKYAVVTMLTLFHDAMIPLGLFTFLGKWYGVEVDINFIVAILVVIGFSVHDTIVVFDRIRENLRLSKRTDDFAGLVDHSIKETIARSINTSLTLIIVLIVLFILGAASLKYFVLAMLVGTVAGTYSSIFVASPLLVVWHQLSAKK